MTCDNKVHYACGKIGKDLCADTNLPKTMGNMQCVPDCLRKKTFGHPVKALSHPRQVFMILETEKTPDNQYIACIAVEGERGYYRTDWYWGKDRDIADTCAKERNERMGIDEDTAWKIIAGTMRK